MTMASDERIRRAYRPSASTSWDRALDDYRYLREQGLDAATLRANFAQVIAVHPDIEHALDRVDRELREAAR